MRIQLRFVATASVAMLLHGPVHADAPKSTPALTPTLQATAAQKPSRTVEGTTITSTEDPAVRLTLPTAARYVGADRWVLYGVADCEIHLFVEADAEGNIRRLYWVQFEGYIPSRPELKYRPNDKRIEKIGGLEFRTRARFGPTTEPARADSDLDRAIQLLRGKGYKLPTHMMNVRFIHYLDEAMRKELMIIVGEDLTLVGKTSDQLMMDKAPTEEWAPISEGLVQRAKMAIQLVPTAAPK